MLFMVSSSYQVRAYITRLKSEEVSWEKEGNVDDYGKLDFKNSTGKGLTFCSLKGICAKLCHAEQKTVPLINNVSNPVAKPETRKSSLPSTLPEFSELFPPLHSDSAVLGSSLSPTLTNEVSWSSRLQSAILMSPCPRVSPSSLVLVTTVWCHNIQWSLL